LKLGVPDEGRIPKEESEEAMNGGPYMEQGGTPEVGAVSQELRRYLGSL